MKKLYHILPELKRAGSILVILFVFHFFTFLVLDMIYPIDLLPRTQTRVILAEDGTPLRSFSDKNGIWRYPVVLNDVSPRYIAAVLGYEDRWFYYHPGVNPISLIRAAYQWGEKGKIVSGGSTLTMQVARLRRPMSRNITGKFLQIFSALQLEWHYEKEEILTYYLNNAPFGGTFEGVLAASYAYFGHNAKNMTHAQAALLAVLPQAPSRYRPDRYPKAARNARDKLLKRLNAFGIWSSTIINDSKMEKVTGWPIETQMNAPLLARRLHNQTPVDKPRIKTFINYHLQLAMEQLAEDYSASLPPRLSLAILAMNNQTGGVEAYVGSADFLNLLRFGHVDMVKASRSPGSTMKPFIYGMALDEGLIHSQSMLMDVPVQFGDYHPVNFQRNFSGPVSVSKALSDSLNLPAVQLLDHLGPRFFYARMINASFKISFPSGAAPNLSMALGGFSTSLEDLVFAYSCLGREGKAIKPLFTSDSKISQHRLLSQGSAWIIHDILIPEYNHQIQRNDRLFAIKTGTSYGFRDSWAIGVDKGYTVGVWVGRPDGTPVPGHYGAQTATPLLKMAFQLLPSHQNSLKRPDSVTKNKICWPGGSFTADTEHCDEPRNAWLLNRTAPRTLTPTKKEIGSAVHELTLMLTGDKKYRIPAGCSVKEKTIKTSIKLWPKALESWIPEALRRRALIPPVFPGCSKTSNILIIEPIIIEGINNGEIIMRKNKESSYPIFDLSVQGGNAPWYWFENSILKTTGKGFKFTPTHPGNYQLLVVDQSGEVDKVELNVY